jgi:hypothetical protein
MNDNEWIPIASGVLPEDEKVVQVTYLGYNDHLPYCDEFAFRRNGRWFWNNFTNVTVEITAWKKNCKPYGAKTIGKITRMGMRIQFDHAIELDKHYISPGGYIFVCNGKSYHFDFLDYEGSVDAEDPTILYAEVYHLDENYSNKLDDFVAEELTTIEEFYIYTGEGNDAEINPIAVLSLIIEQNGVTTEVDKKILKSIKF